MAILILIRVTKCSGTREEYQNSVEAWANVAL